MKLKINYKLELHAILIMIMMLGLFEGCKKSSNSPPTQGSNDVWIQNMAFGPSTLTVNVNTTVNWVNKDGNDHTFTSDSGS